MCSTTYIHVYYVYIYIYIWPANIRKDQILISQKTGVMPQNTKICLVLLHVLAEVFIPCILRKEISTNISANLWPSLLPPCVYSWTPITPKKTWSSTRSSTNSTPISVSQPFRTKIHNSFLHQNPGIPTPPLDVRCRHSAARLWPPSPRVKKNTVITVNCFYPKTWGLLHLRFLPWNFGI